VLVGTPLGNRADLSPRARDALFEADLLLCEDTRSPTRLLGNGVKLPPRVSCFVGNERECVAVMLEHLQRGEIVAYATEAGLPMFSDPGRVLVAAAVDAGHGVDVVPGPTAATVAVVHSGFATDEVRLLGFLPRSGTDRQARLMDISDARATVVLYEAGNRVSALFRDLAQYVPDGGARRAIVARELTKVHQEILRDTIAGLAERLTEPLRGEVTVVVERSTRASTQAHDDQCRRAREVLDIVLDSALTPRQRAKRLAELTGMDARDIYDKWIRAKREF